MKNDYTEYLMHKNHKYISKDWVKGKWRYSYSDKKLKRRIEDSTTWIANGAKDLVNNTIDIATRAKDATKDFINDITTRHSTYSDNRFINAGMNFIDDMMYAGKDFMSELLTGHTTSTTDRLINAGQDFMNKLFKRR